MPTRRLRLPEVVVLDDAMRGDEGIDADLHQADLVGLDRRDYRAHDRPRDDGAVFGLLGDDDLGFAPSVDEKAAKNFCRVDLVMQGRRRDSAAAIRPSESSPSHIQTLARSFRHDAKQGAAGDDRQRLDLAKRGFSQTRDRDRLGNEAADIVMRP